MKVIKKSVLIQFYHDLLSYGTIHGAKLPSLEEFLQLSLNQSPKKETDFDETTDKLLEERAKKLLEERRMKHGK